MTQTDKAAEPVASNTNAPEEIWADEQIEHVGNRNNYHCSWSEEPQTLQHEEWAQKPTRYIRADLAHPQDAESLRAEVERLRGTLKPFGDAVYNDNGDVTIDQSHVHRGHWLAARAVLQRKAGE